MDELYDPAEYEDENMSGEPKSKRVAHRKSQMQILTLDDVLKYDFKSTEWLVDKLIPVSSVVLMPGNPASYKTWLVLELARSIASGDKFVGEFPTIKKRVLIVDEENGNPTLQERIKLMRIQGVEVFFLSYEGLKLDDDIDTSTLEKFIEENQIEFVIFDSLVRFYSGDENSSRSVSQVFENIRRRLTKKKVACLLTHHNRKTMFGSKIDANQNMRGSSDILASADIVLSVEKEIREGKNPLIAVTQSKNRRGVELPSFAIEFIADEQQHSVQLKYLGPYDKKEINLREKKVVIHAVLDAYSGRKLSKIEIMEVLKQDNIEFTANAISNALGVMVEGGEIQLEKGASNKHLYYKNSSS